MLTTLLTIVIYLLIVVIRYCDNSDEFDRDEDGYEEWTKFKIADDIDDFKEL